MSIARKEISSNLKNSNNLKKFFADIHTHIYIYRKPLMILGAIM